MVPVQTSSNDQIISFFFQKLKAEFTSATLDENSTDSSALTPNPQADKGDIGEAEEEELDEGEEEVLLQFDFEDTMNAKKKALVVSNSSSNLTASVVPLPSSSSSTAAMLALATAAASSSSKVKEEASGAASGTAAALDSCDKEKMEVLKSKEKKPYFDIFADDDEYESVSSFHPLFQFVQPHSFQIDLIRVSLLCREPKTCWI